MPEAAEQPITEPVAGPNDAQGSEANQEPNWFKDRLARFEKSLTEKHVDPLKKQLEDVRARAQENGLDLALLGLAPEGATPAAAAPKVSEDTVKLNRLSAAYEAGLPREALPLITETTPDGIKAQVVALTTLGLKGSRIRSPMPASGPNGNPLPIYRRSQLRDGKFFQANEADIRKAMAEGRIENDN